MMNKNPVNPVNLVILSLLAFTIRLTTFAQVETLVQREMRERRIRVSNQQLKKLDP